ncbi:hypothetical protein ACHAWT_005122 [Skeletonema menzelii]
MVVMYLAEFEPRIASRGSEQGAFAGIPPFIYYANVVLPNLFAATSTCGMPKIPFCVCTP